MTTIEQDRAEFEDWYKSNVQSSAGFTMFNGTARANEYHDGIVQFHWRSWQASAQLQRERQRSSSAWTSDYINDVNLKSSTLEQFCRDNGLLAPFFFMLANALATPQQSHIPAIDVNKMVDRFLGWKLPDDFSPDCGISFKKEVSWPNHVYPIGTNLFNATQAKAMFEYCIHYQSDFNLEYTAKRIRRLLNVMDLPDPSNGNDNTLMGCLFSLLGQVCGKLESATPSAPIAQQSYADGLEATAKIVDEEFGL